MPSKLEGVDEGKKALFINRVERGGGRVLSRKPLELWRRGSKLRRVKERGKADAICVKKGGGLFGKEILTFVRKKKERERS